MDRDTEDRVRQYYTARVVIYEEPAVAQELNQIAIASGRSLSAEIRAAIRYWIRAHDD